MHTLYVNARQHMFTTVTFNELRSRNVHLLPLPDAMEICVENLDRTLFNDLQFALKIVYGQRQHTFSRVRLSIEDCKVLRSVAFSILFCAFRNTQYFLLLSFH